MSGWAVSILWIFTHDGWAWNVFPCLVLFQQLSYIWTATLLAIHIIIFFLHHHQMVPACETFMATHMNQQPRGKEKRDVQKAECGKTAEVYIEKVGGSKSLGLLCNYPLN